MKEIIHSGLTIIMIALILLTTGIFSQAEEAGTSHPDKEVNALKEDFKFSKQYPVAQSAISRQSDADKLATEITMSRLDKHFWTLCLVILAMLVSNFSLLYFIRKSDHCADDIVHASGLVLVIFGTILIVVISDTDQQLTASIGIMGAVAGYLFGRIAGTKSTGEEKNKDKSK